MVKSGSGKSNMRSFTLVEATKFGGCKTKFRGGRYVNRTPAQAARKAFSELCRRKKVKGVCTLNILVKETTQGSKHKVYSYKLNRKKLAKPVVLKSNNGGEYKIEYTTVIKTAPMPQACKSKGQTRGRMRTVTRGNRKNKRLSAKLVRRAMKRASKKRN